MALSIIVTNAGRAALVNAANTGTAPVLITEVGLSASAQQPGKTATSLPGEFKRLTTLSGDVVADDTIHLIVRDESAAVYQVRSVALYLGDGTLFAVYGQAATIIDKAAGAIMLLAIDVQFADIAAPQIAFGNANFLNPPATTEQIGVVELATLDELMAGIDTGRTPAAKVVKDAVFAWLDARFGVNNAAVWTPANDGAGSGLDADLLDGKDSSYFTSISARLGFTPVQQGGGIGQLNNPVRMGWGSNSRVKVTIDNIDMGNVVFDSHVSDVWRASNDGAGSGLDADLLDGRDWLGGQTVSFGPGSFNGNVTIRNGADLVIESQVPGNPPSLIYNDRGTFGFKSNNFERIYIDQGGVTHIKGQRAYGNETTIPGSGNLRVFAGAPGGYALQTYDFFNYWPLQVCRDISGSVTMVGGISCTDFTTTFVTSSDYRLKEDLRAVSDPLARLNAINVYNFRWIGTDRRTDGFVAHELAEVIPEAVTGERDAMRDVEVVVQRAKPAVLDKDGKVIEPAVSELTRIDRVPDYQGVDQSKVVPLVVAALQALDAKVEGFDMPLLVAEVQALAAKVDAFELPLLAAKVQALADRIEAIEARLAA